MDDRIRFPCGINILQHVHCIFALLCHFCEPNTWILILVVSLRAAFMTKMMLVGDQAFKFNIWDTAGQERVCQFGAYFVENDI